MNEIKTGYYECYQCNGSRKGVYEGKEMLCWICKGDGLLWETRVHVKDDSVLRETLPPLDMGSISINPHGLYEPGEEPRAAEKSKSKRVGWPKGKPRGKKK